MAVVRVFLDVSMNLGIPGLTNLINTHGLKSKEPNSMYMFVNSNRNQVKIMWQEKYLVQVRQSRPVTIEDLKAIPAFFRDGVIGKKIESKVTKHLSAKSLITVNESGLTVL